MPRVVIEADGGSRGNPGPAAYGALLRNADTGEVIAERGESIGVATNNVAEYRGLIAGLELLREHDPGITDVEVRMDSKLVIEQMAGRWKVKHPDMVPLASQAQRLRQGLEPRWAWVPRAENAAADRLVNVALDRATGHSPKSARRDKSTDPPRDTAGPRVAAAGRGEPTRLLLLRHGQTELTAGKRFSGSGGADPSLDDTGRAQADAAAGWLEARGGVDVVLTSPAARAQETAHVAADALSLTSQVDEGLREVDFGAWDGLTLVEVEDGWAERARCLARVNIGRSPGWRVRRRRCDPRPPYPRQDRARPSRHDGAGGVAPDSDQAAGLRGPACAGLLGPPAAGGARLPERRRVVRRRGGHGDGAVPAPLAAAQPSSRSHAQSTTTATMITGGEISRPTRWNSAAGGC